MQSLPPCGGPFYESVMKRLYRDRWDKKVAGICGGMGQFLRLDPTIIRLFVTFFCILTGLLPIGVVYVIGWILIPLGPRTYIEIKCRKLYLSEGDRKLAGLCSGIAKTFGIDPTVVRLITLIALFITGFFPILITYIVGMCITPKKYHF